MVFYRILFFNIFILKLTVLKEVYSSSIFHHSKCYLLVNERNYEEEKRLFIYKRYDFAFGLPITNSSNSPIGFSIDSECVNSNDLTKSKAYYSLDLKDIPIEINVYNCPGVFFLENIRLKNLPKYDLLSFTFDFQKTFKNFTFDIKSKLTLNKRLGNGCLRSFSMYKKPQNSLFDVNFAFEENFYDLENPNINSKFVKYWTITTSNIYFFTIFLMVIIILTCFFVLIVWCIRKTFLSDKFQITNKLEKFKNFKKNNKQDDFDFSKLSNSKETIFCKDNDNHGSGQNNETNRITIEKDKKQDENQTTPINEFQVLRHQLINKMSNEDNEKNFNLDANLSKNIIFQT